MAIRTDVAIVGAGPYGLSLAAHLAAAGVNLRIFGEPMQTWQEHMPEGMVLKSEGFASTLHDPQRRCTLQAYCAEHGLPYADVGLPVPLKTFCDYGNSFQQRCVPMLDRRMVTYLERSGDGFRLTLDDGETTEAHRVVVAAGIAPFWFIPPELGGLPKPLLSHSIDHHKLDGFSGKEVAIIGGGASSLDLAALMHERKAAVTVITRGDRIAWCDPPRPRSMIDKIRWPMSGIGTGWRSLACELAPMVFHRMPAEFRVMVVRKHLGPAPGWSVREYVEQNVPIALNAIVADAREIDGRAYLRLRMQGGGTQEITTDHVIAATGFRVNLDRLAFLSLDLRARMKRVDQAPALSGQFESSIPGLYFIGTAAANSFGPLLRFAHGAGFASRRLSAHLSRLSSRSAVAMRGGLQPVQART
ncbi:MAG: FAD-dependent oxidoreductase [Acetobacteraceae bacterium]